MRNAVDVIEMLEICYSRSDCASCPYENLDIESCSRGAVADAIVALKHLQKENESLKAELTDAHQAINAAKAKLRAAGLLWLIFKRRKP